MSRQRALLFRDRAETNHRRKKRYVGIARDDRAVVLAGGLCREGSNLGNAATVNEKVPYRD